MNGWLIQQRQIMAILNGQLGRRGRGLFKVGFWHLSGSNEDKNEKSIWRQSDAGKRTEPGSSAVRNRSDSHCTAGKQTSYVAVRTSCYALTRWIPETKNSTVSHKGLHYVRICILRAVQLNHPELFYVSCVQGVFFCPASPISSARRSASVASYATCQVGLIFDDGARQTNAMITF
jgi:hypothetical protein